MKKILLSLAFGLLAFTGLPQDSVRANDILVAMTEDLGSTRPSGCPSRWCACYLDLVLGNLGLPMLGSHRARDFAHYGAPAEPGAVGAIMVMPNHVGVVSGRCPDGRVQIVSGNYSNRVKVGCYRASKAIAWRTIPGHEADKDRPRTLMDWLSGS